jgi:hypothetical protein
MTKHEYHETEGRTGHSNIIARRESVVGKRAKRDETRQTWHTSARAEGGARSCLLFGEDELGVLYWEREQRTIYTKIFEEKG